MVSTSAMLDYGLVYYTAVMGCLACLPFALVLTGYNVYENRFRILTFALICGVYETVLFYGPQSLRLALIIPLDIVMIKLLFRLPRIFLVIFLYEFITLISQVAGSFVWHYVLGTSTTEFLASPLMRLLFPPSFCIPVTILAYISYRKRWRISLDTSRFKIPAAAILPIVIQVILLGAVINEFFFGSLFDEAARTTEAVIFAMLIAALVSSSFIFWRILRLSEREAAVTAQEILAAEMRKQIDTVRKQRHDFINHVQIMQALLSENRFAELSSLVDAIDKDIHKVL
ncbi:MAG: hypothetical protein AB1510_05215 [Bacillota bacterium]